MTAPRQFMAENLPHAVIILAAGASRRMGQPKQLLPVSGHPLLRGVARAAVDARVGPVCVVLGANAEKIRPSLDGLMVDTIVNDAWEEGMGASIRAGLTAMAHLLPALRGIIVALGDQPGMSAAHLLRLIQTQYDSGKSIVASRCAGKLSPPVWFAPTHFPALRTLCGDAGARALLQANPRETAVVDADDLSDLDTPDDYAEFLKRRAE